VAQTPVAHGGRIKTKTRRHPDKRPDKADRDKSKKSVGTIGTKETNGKTGAMTTDGLKTIQDYKDAAAALKATQPNTLGVAFAVAGAGGDAGNDAADLNNSAAVLERQAKTVQNLTVGLLLNGYDESGAAPGDIAGQQITGTGAGIAAAQAAAVKKKEREQQYINLLLQQLRDLDRRIAANNEQIKVLQEELTELRELEQLAKGGKLDPDDPRHAALMEKYGITEDDIKHGLALAKIYDAQGRRQDSINELNRVNEDLNRQRQENAAEIRASGAYDSLSTEEKREVDGQRVDNLDLRLEQLNLQQQSGVTNTNEIDNVLAKAGQKISVDEEVKEFMQEYERSKQLENNIEMLTRQKELIEGLSDEAKENISYSEQTEHLFDEGYFKPLEHAHAENEPARLNQAYNPPTLS
jgi:hypothetical protein